ncbi:hypothetical protein B9Z55_007122 [Caenorhabditis nigoni]|uniref:Bromodomain associated domain-containing protein n=1 Tax=Caenorhabditis nigoni TaxID=1611254 RepID=A0A2G5V8H5_9PELO|nr:hypothetical protein B9Z55_007122 [Caenorhabditis nigoni]
MPPTSYDFAIHYLEIVIKRLIEDQGFHFISRGAIKKLAGILRGILEKYGESTRLFMEHAGRTKPIVEDAVAVLKLKKVNIREIRDYAKHATPEMVGIKVPIPLDESIVAPGDDNTFEN